MRGEPEPAFARGPLAQVEPDGDERGGAVDLPVVGQVAVGNAARDPLLDLTRSDDCPHLGGGIAGGIHGGDDRTHRGARDVIDGYAVLFEGLEHADMVEALGTAAAHDDPHCLRFGGVRRPQCEQEKTEALTYHIADFL